MRTRASGRHVGGQLRLGGQRDTALGAHDAERVRHEVVGDVPQVRLVLGDGAGGLVVSQRFGLARVRGEVPGGGVGVGCVG